MNTIQKIKFPNGQNQLFKWLLRGHPPLNRLWENPIYRFKFLLRSLFLSRKTFAWVNHLSQYPLLGYFLSQQTNLPCKLQRPYLASCMGSQDCFQALCFHYDFLSENHQAFSRAVYDDVPFIIGRITGKNEHTFRFDIQARNKFAREGEITLSLFDEQNDTLAYLTFSIIKYCQKPTLFIAGLQGGGGEKARESIQQATKACYGLFPKRIILEAALTVAKAFALTQVVAVSNKTHIYNNWRYRSRRERVHSDYDEFWQSIGAVADARDLFILPSQIERKTIEEIQSKKRSEYRNRYALLDQLAQNMTDELSLLS